MATFPIHADAANKVGDGFRVETHVNLRDPIGTRTVIDSNRAALNDETGIRIITTLEQIVPARNVLLF